MSEIQLTHEEHNHVHKVSVALFGDHFINASCFCEEGHCDHSFRNQTATMTAVSKMATKLKSTIHDSLSLVLEPKQVTEVTGAVFVPLFDFSMKVWKGECKPVYQGLIFKSELK